MTLPRCYRLGFARTSTSLWTRVLGDSLPWIGLVLVFCVISLSFMSIALLWQAQIIANQREAIQWLEHLKFGG